METPKTLLEAIKFFSDKENCRQFMISVRWADGVVRCPTCGSEGVTYLATANVYKCKTVHPKQKFSLKVGTVFEDSPIGLDKWLPASWMLSNCKNGISSYELSRDLGVTQKTAWFMLHRIRKAMANGSMMKIGGNGGEVEADETFIGGRARNMHKSVHERRITGMGQSFRDKTIVMGVLERGGEIRTAIIPDRLKTTLQPVVRQHVEAGAALFTDEMGGYKGLDGEYLHQIIDHAVRYVDGRIHTNGMENFWSLLKRGINGTYVSVEPFHLFRYLDEQAFRYNNRATKKNPMTDSDRFSAVLSQVAGKRLTYAEVTGKVGETIN